MKNTKVLLAILFLSGTVLNGAVSNADTQRITADLPGALKELLGHNPAVLNAFDTEKNSLMNKKTKYQPWTGSYWPDINGGITNAYRDHATGGTRVRLGMKYPIAKRKVKRDHSNIIEKFNVWDTDKMNEKLSPAHKYDLLLGNEDFRFAQNIIEELDFRDEHRIGNRYKDGSTSGLGSLNEDSTGEDNTRVMQEVTTRTNEERSDSIMKNSRLYSFWAVEDESLAMWSGICDGWSPASLHMPRPVKTVTVTGAKGHIIQFFPDDLKALGSYLFAKSATNYFSSMNYKYSGRLCNQSKNKLDRNDDGSLLDPRCNDVDAGLFHLLLVNRIGKDGMGFVMDFDNNRKVNNHPVMGYRSEYYNPITGKKGSLKNSMVPRFTVKDTYAQIKDRRHPKGVFLVGVRTQLSYMFYAWAEDARDLTTDFPGRDIIKTVEYVYDLELDEKGNVLGGEWGDRSDESNTISYAKNNQPDFMWLAGMNDLPYSQMSVDAYPGFIIDFSKPRPFGNRKWAWDGKSQMPLDWQRAAQKDLTWFPPIVPADLNNIEYEARNSELKSPQLMSHIIYYLFDQARDPNQM
jgi:hypothetical protein